MRNIAVLGMFLFVISGCAPAKQTIITLQPPEMSSEVAVISKPYKVQRSKIVNDLNNAINGVDDKYSRIFVDGEINKYVPLSSSMVSYADDITCDKKKEYFLNGLEPTMKNMSSPVSYVAKTLNLFGVGIWSLDFRVTAQPFRRKGGLCGDYLIVKPT